MGGDEVEPERKSLGPEKLWAPGKSRETSQVVPRSSLPLFGEVWGEEGGGIRE